MEIEDKDMLIVAMSIAKSVNIAAINNNFPSRIGDLMIFRDATNIERIKIVEKYAQRINSINITINTSLINL